FNIKAERERFEAALKNERKEFGRRCPLVIDHEAIPTREWTPSFNPANQQEIIGYSAQAGLEHVEAAVAAARRAQPGWAGTSAEKRAAIVEKVADLMQRTKASLSALEVFEAGKSWREADADVAEAIDFCRFYAAVMREKGMPRRTEHVPGETNFQRWQPRGTGVIIAPWNFPLAILTGMTAAAVVAGNSAIMKPSDQTPVIAARLMDLFMEAGCPAGVVNFLPGSGSLIGSRLVEHAGIDFIAFTGSKEVGLKIWEAAGRMMPGQQNLKKVVCEMGGKNAVIVDDDADLDETVAGSLASGFGYQGQKCSALSRLIVLAANYEKFVKRFLAAADSMRFGPPEDPRFIFGPVISRSAQERILQMIETGKSEARLLWQGAAPASSEGCYVPPTIFAEVPPDSRLFREEIFGPVVSITRAADFQDALDLANRSEFALTGGCYSRSPSNIERAMAEFQCGNLYINRGITGALVARQPFGGFKMSGGGTKAGGREYLENFMVPRVITENCLRRGFAPEDGCEECETSR
ncbi:MAG TPA: L-glutamate gamma-semialdehyde dehydrogenase, partial [Verrucomicrobiae bacterium]|nr:L-glutamate gamma-semialdehyde dehydrogenase [Verrucomicrobiae bacterium]